MIKYKYITFRENRNVYQVKITLKYGSESKIITRTTKTLPEALKARADLFTLYRLDKNLLVDIHEARCGKQRGTKATIVSETLLKDDITKWYEIQKKPYIELQTQNRYNTIISKVIVPIIGNLNVRNVTRSIIQQTVIALTQNGRNDGVKKGLAVSSCRIVVLLIKQYYDYLIDTGLDIKNPCYKIKYPKTPPQRRESLTGEEVDKVLNYIKVRSPQKHFLFTMYFATGCRRGELLALPWRYVDFDRHTITIQNTIVYNPNNGRWVIKLYPKNPNSIRTIYVSDENMAQLKKMHDYAKTHDKNFGVDSLVFLNKLRQPNCPKKITVYFKTAVRAVGIEKNVSLHSTRHTFATKLINAKVPIPVVQRLGGWGKPNTLLSIYAHSDVKAELEAMQKVIF
jgi:integrase